MRTTRRQLMQGAGLASLATCLPVSPAGAANPAGMTLTASVADLARVFRDPPPEARPGVFWYWMNGIVTREGIAADLAAMAKAGIGRAILFTIGLGPTPAGMKQYPSLTPEWWTLVAFAIAEAGRLGLEITMGACDGWATAGGPWITPELSMQRVTWSEAWLHGGTRAGTLPMPPTAMGHYRDIRTIAFPMPKAWETSVERRPRVSTSFGIADPARINDDEARDALIDTTRAGWVRFDFDRPFTVRGVIADGPDGGAGRGLTLEASDDGRTFRTIGRLAQANERTAAEAHDVGPAGGPPEPRYVVDGAPATTARYFRLAFTPGGADQRPAPQHFTGPTGDPVVHPAPPRLRLARLVLTDERTIPDLAARAARAWSLPPTDLTEAELPRDACVAVADIVDLTARVGADGRLDWTPPDARVWKVVRIGHTSNGAINSTGFPAGRGLECDKMNPAATRLQFDGWLGELTRRIDRKHVGRALSTMHTDSWECGSQNWSPVFAAEFRKRRGYDVLPFVAMMAGVPIANADTVDRVLSDIRRTIAEATADNFFGVLARLGHQAGYDYSLEPANPIYPTDPLIPAKFADRPMGEFWVYGDDKPSDMAEAIHGGHVYGRRVIGAEAFTEFAMQWNETPYSCKPLGDANWAKGVNQLTCHVWAAQPWTDAAHEPGMTLANIGVFFSRTNTWFDMAKPWFEYMTRGQALLQQGRPVADVACFIGEQIPARAYVPSNTPLPIPPGHAFDSINTDALLTLATVRDGWIVLPGGQRYAVLLLPRDFKVTAPVLRRIATLAQAGATVIGAPPTASLGYDGGAGEVGRLAASLWSADTRLRRYGKGWIGTAEDLAGVLSERAAPPDCLILEPRPPAGKAADIMWTHRSGADWDLYFLSNQSAVAQTVRARVRAVADIAERWDADSGAVHPIAHRIVQGGTELTVEMDPCGSAFVLLRRGRPNVPPAVSARSQSVAVEGPWRVTFTRGLTTAKTVELARLDSWSDHADPDIRHYAGTATYETRFDAPRDGGPWRIDLGDVAEVCEVALNGHVLGRLWKPPFVVDLRDALRPGENRLVVRVANTWRNRLVGDADRSPGERRSFTVTPFFSKTAPSFGPTFDPDAPTVDADGLFLGGGFDNDAAGVPLRGSPAGTPPARVRGLSRYGFPGGGSSAPGPDVRRTPDTRGLLASGLLGPVRLVR